jgi:tetratricopeptide (TPR) repeat protein
MNIYQNLEMMRLKTCAISLFVFAICNLSGQNRLVDSCENVLRTHQHDTDRVRTLNFVNYEFIVASDFEKAINVARECLSISKKNKYKFGIAISYRDLSVVYYSMGNFDSALFYARNQLRIEKERGYKSSQAECYHVLGGILFAIGQLDSSLYYSHLALDRFTEVRDSMGMAKSYINISNFHFDRGEYIQVMKYLDMALGILKAKNNQFGIAVTLHNRSGVYTFLGSHSLAIEDLYAELKINKKLGNKSGEAAGLNSIGMVLQKQGRYDDAMKKHKEALQIATQIGDKPEHANSLAHLGNIAAMQGYFGDAMTLQNKAHSLLLQIGQPKAIANSHNDIGQLCYDQGQYRNALEHISKALQIHGEIGYQNGIADSYNHLAKVYLKLKNKSAAVDNIDKALLLGVQLKDETLLKEIYYTYSRIDSANKDFRAAYEHYILFTKAKDTIFNSENEKKITQIIMQYEFDKKTDSLLYANKLSDNKILLQAALFEGSKRNRNLIIVSLCILFCFTGLLIYRRNQRRKLVYQRQVDLMEIKTLKAQMNPHFIFNALNSIYNFVELNKSELAASYILKFSRLMRLILKNSMEPSISLKMELEVLQLYVDLEKERLSHKFEFRVSIDHAIDANETLVPPLIFQPLIENSIWHGMSQRSDGGLITLEVTKNNQLLKFVITDNGINMSQVDTSSANQDKRGSEHKSYGMQLTNERIDVLHKMKNISSEDRQIQMNTVKDENEKVLGTRVTFTLPFESAN